MTRKLYRVGVRHHEDGRMLQWYTRSGWGVSRLMSDVHRRFPSAHELSVEQDDSILDRLREAARARACLYGGVIEEREMVKVLRECGIDPDRGGTSSDRNASLRGQVRAEIGRLSGPTGTGETRDCYEINAD
jgi:hypothetical protein